MKLYRRRLDAVAPGLPLTLSLSGARSVEQLYEEKGIDLEAIAAVPGVSLGVSRSPTGHLWKLYRRQETKGDAELYDLGNPLYAEIRRLSGGAVDMVCEHNTYFETFTLTMVIYLIMTVVCSRLLMLLERKMDGPDTYVLATTDTLAHTSGMMSYSAKKGGR